MANSRTVAAAFVGAVLLVASCGEGEGPSAQPSTDAVENAPASSPEPTAASADDDTATETTAQEMRASTEPETDGAAEVSNAATGRSLEPGLVRPSDIPGFSVSFETFQNEGAADNVNGSGGENGESEGPSFEFCDPEVEWPETIASARRRLNPDDDAARERHNAAIVVSSVWAFEAAAGLGPARSYVDSCPAGTPLESSPQEDEDRRDISVDSISVTDVPDLGDEAVAVVFGRAFDIEKKNGSELDFVLDTTFLFVQSGEVVLRLEATATDAPNGHLGVLAPLANTALARLGLSAPETSPVATEVSTSSAPPTTVEAIAPSVELTAEEFASAIAPGPRPDAVSLELTAEQARASIRHADIVDLIPADLLSSAASVEYFNLGAEEPVAVATLYRTGTPEEATRIHTAVVEALQSVIQAGSFNETLNQSNLYAIARNVIDRDMLMQPSPTLGGWVILSELGTGSAGTTDWVYDTGQSIADLS